MNKDKWLFIGTDKRMSLGSEIMSARGYACQAVQTDCYTEELEKVIKEFAPKNIVFPILQMKGTIPLELLPVDTQLYTGVTTAEWLTPFQQAGFTIHPYLKEERFVWENARLTAEAFISVYYERTKQAIAGKHFYVAGYGRVGKMVADVLTSLGGQVTVIARSDSDIGEAEARGFAVDQLTVSFEPSSHLINTIPAQWLCHQPNSSLFIFDLASAPGCLTDASMPEYYTILPGLPGKYFPTDAATALADALERIHRR